MNWLNRFGVVVLPALMVSVLMTAPRSADAFVIDDFQVGNPGLTVLPNTTGGTMETGLPALNVVGMSRFTEIENSAVSLGNATASTTVGKLALGSEPGTTALFRLIYNENGSGLGGGSGIDMTSGGATGFLVDFFLADAGSSTTVTLTSGSGSATRTLSTPGAGILFFAYNTFTTAGIFDITGVTQIEFEIQGLSSGDYIIEIIQSDEQPTPQPEPQPSSGVPEPSTASLALLGLLVLSRRSRR